MRSRLFKLRWSAVAVAAMLCGGCAAPAGADLTAFLTDLARNAAAALLL